MKLRELTFLLCFTTILGGCSWPGASYVSSMRTSTQRFWHSFGHHLFVSVLKREWELARKSGDAQPIDALGQSAVVKFTLDPDLQKFALKLFEEYRPEYGALVAIEPKSGKILAIVQATADFNVTRDLSMRAMFPAASVFKIITAAAALDTGKLTADSPVTYQGGDHDLFRYSVVEPTDRKKKRQMILRHAFAHSVNPVFAKIGLDILDPGMLERYALRFHFNRPFTSDLWIESGDFTAPSPGDWSLAETAAGYNWNSLMSPVQGAAIAAAIANDGLAMEPFVLDNVKTVEGTLLYQAETKNFGQAIRPESAAALRTLMRETVETGTSSKYFRGFQQPPGNRFIELGGKTGTLASLTPKGRCDWFVGYGRQADESIAVGVLTVHTHPDQVKSSFLARRFLEKRFSNEPLRSIASAASPVPAADENSGADEEDENAGGSPQTTPPAEAP